MKKLRLKAVELKGFEILTREQLRNEIAGGTDPGSGGSSGGGSGGSGGGSYSGGGCGHNITCYTVGSICGSKGVCGCLYAPNGGEVIYCRSHWG